MTEDGVPEAGVVDTLMGLVQGYKQKEQAGNGGWVAAAIAGVVALIAVALYAWQAWQAGKERAKLLHEKALREEEKRQELVDAELAPSVEITEEAIAAVVAIEEELLLLDAQVVAAEAVRTQARDAINKISTWEDVDAIVR